MADDGRRCDGGERPDLPREVDVEDPRREHRARAGVVDGRVLGVAVLAPGECAGDRGEEEEGREREEHHGLARRRRRELAPGGIGLGCAAVGRRRPHALTPLHATLGHRALTLLEGWSSASVQRSRRRAPPRVTTRERGV